MYSLYSNDPYIKVSDPEYLSMCVCDGCDREGSIAYGTLHWISQFTCLLCNMCLENAELVDEEK